MKRRKFIAQSGLAIGGLSLMNLTSAKSFFNALPTSDRMPAMFIGHGSPMNAIEQNKYHLKWVELGMQLPRPSAILSISAHWLTQGATKVTAMDKPKTIHDFGGFPKALFEVEYPASGSAEYAKAIIETAAEKNIREDHEWGLDHGTWSVLRPMFPKAEIPVLQLSIDYNKPASYHFELAQQLRSLREKGVLIIGSGNIVHNLRMVNFNATKPYDWAVEFDTFIEKHMANRDFQAIVNYRKLGKLVDQAHPSVDHFLPLLYSLALLDDKDKIETFNANIDMGSVSMRSFLTA